MNVGKRLLTLVLAVAVAVLVLAGCGGGGSSSGGKTLTLGSIGWTENIAVSTLTQVVMQDELGYEEVQIKGPLDLGPLFQGGAKGVVGFTTDPGQPFLMLPLIDLWNQELQRLFRIADDRNIRLNVFPDLGRVDIDVDDFRLWRKP